MKKNRFTQMKTKNGKEQKKKSQQQLKWQDNVNDKKG